MASIDKCNEEELKNRILEALDCKDKKHFLAVIVVKKDEDDKEQVHCMNFLSTECCLHYIMEGLKGFKTLEKACIESTIKGLAKQIDERGETDGKQKA
jgi:hypothetical protein